MSNLTEEEKICTLALIHTPGVGAVSVRQLISYCGSASTVFKTGYRNLIKIPGIGDKVARLLLEKKSLGFAEKEFRDCEKADAQLHFYTDTTYPYRLKPLYDAPIVLYSRGKFDFNAHRTVGIVGTRQVSEYGKQITETIIKDLIPFNPLIVSGLAYGVDITAHRACLKNGLSTIGVMASGLNIIYPSAHKKASVEMQELGGIVSENALDTKPDFMRFPARNRIIAGLSDVTIVVESAKKGGSLITVEFAQNYHREVFAVPGALNQPQSEGCNQLIKENKAAIFISTGQMAEAIGWDPGQEGGESKVAGNKHMNPLIFEGLSVEEGQVVSLLRQRGAVQIDDISWSSGLHLNKLATLLLNLEFQGIVKSLPGKKYALN